MTLLRFDVMTLFPGAFDGPMDVSILGRARKSGLFEFHTHDIREHATDRHHTVDDYPFGGGQGMVMRVDVLDRALQHVRSLANEAGKVVYLSPAGRPLTDRLVRELAREPRLILVCGRYEGIDERFVEHHVDIEVSVGDYVLTGGELPAMVLIDAVARHIPGVLGDDLSPEDESFADGLLEHPQYTRPSDYEGWKVPSVLLAGKHADIEAWRRRQRVERTAVRRPDLLPPGERGGGALRKVGVPGVRVRPACYPDDIPDVLALWLGVVPGTSTEAVPTRLAAMAERQPELFLVAEQARRIIGALLGGWDGWRGHLYELAVAPAERRRGIATALLTEFEQSLRSLDCPTIQFAGPVADDGCDAFLASRGWSQPQDAAWHRDLRP